MGDYMKPTPTCETELLNSKLEKDGDNLGVVTGYQMVAMGESYEELMKVFLAKNGPLSLAINANGMEYYIHGIVGCESIAGMEFRQAGSAYRRQSCVKKLIYETWGEDGYDFIERGIGKCGYMFQHTVLTAA